MWSAIRSWRGVWWVVPVVLTLVLAGRSLQLWQTAEWAFYDQLYQLRAAEPPERRIVIVGIDETDIQELGTYPVPDGVLADLLRKIEAQRPRVIGLDIVRDLPVGAGHEDLVQFYKNTPHLVGIAQVALGNQAIAPPPALAEKGQVSAANLPIDADGTVRRAFMGLPSLAPQAEPLLGLGLFTALKYLEGEPSLPFAEVIEKPQLFSGNDGGYVGADAGGDQVIVNFRRSAEGFATVPMRAVLKGQVASDLFRDRLVLVGITAVSKQDFKPTSLDRAWGKPFSQTAGVEIHAQIASHFLSAALDGRHTIKSWAEYQEWLWIAGWAIAGSLWVWHIRHTASPLQFTGLAALGLALESLVLLGCYIWAFGEGWWIPVVPPWLALGLSGLGTAVYIYVDQLRENEQRFRSIAETTPVAILVVDPKKETVLYANSLGESQFFGGNIKGKLVTDIFEQPEDWHNLVQTLRKEGAVSGYELPCRPADGAPMWAIAAMRPLRRDGEPALLLTLSDVTALKQTTESLRRAEASYRSIFENAIEGIFQASPDNTLIRINDSFAKMFGYASAQEMLATVRRFNSLYADAETEAEFQRLMAEQLEILGWEYRALKRDRSIIWIRQSARTVRNQNGDPLYYEGIVEDVSQRRRQEEELKRQMAELQVEIDESRRAKQVAEITETDFFKQLQAEADALRSDN